MLKHIVLKFVLFVVFVFGLSSCGGGGAGGGATGSTSITGGGVKGPLANAIVSVYTFDSSLPGFRSATPVATASTNTAAAIIGLALPFPTSPPYIMEFTSDAGTTDITTGLAPVITTMRTVITQSLLNKKEQIYATPLTTMAVDLGITNADSNVAPYAGDNNGTTTAVEFEAGLTVAASQVVSTVGFGMSGNIDIFDTPPLVDSTTISTQEQADVAAYRTAVEALTAVVFQMEQQSSGDVDAVLSELTSDLGDGFIDGMVGGSAGIPGSASTVFGGTTLTVLAQVPASLPIPNSPSNDTVGDVQAILVAETTTTGTTTSTTQLNSGSIITTSTPAETDPDSDGDGTPNAVDAFPNNVLEDTDTDGDGIGDNADPDIDGDGILNEDEGTVVAPSATDTDGDGVLDAFPDNCPTIVNPTQTNTDSINDGLGDACDDDDDNDGVLDINDAFPLDNSEQTDTDGDGVGNNTDSDDDNDGFSDTVENNAVDNVDGDGITNRLDTDSDGDGVLDSVDFDRYDATVTFNNAPVTTSSSVTTTEDVAVLVALTVSDDIDALAALTYVITGPANGVLTGILPNVTYTPSGQFSGSDSFTFTAEDSANQVSNISTVTITITGVNDAPIILQGNAIPVGMSEDGVPTAFVAPTITAIDADGDALTWNLSATATNGTATASGTGASPTVTYAPNANFNGVDSFDVTVSDGNGGSATTTVTVTVASVNDFPVITQTGPLAVGMDEDATPSAFATPLISALDIDVGAVLSWSGSPASNGTATVSGSGASPTITYVPTTNFNGTDSFDVTVSDGNGGSDVITIVVTVSSQNDVPVIAQSSPLIVSMDEDGLPIAFVAPSVTALDVDGDTLTWSSSVPTAGGSATVSGSGASPTTFTYSPLANFNGSDSFDVTVSDGNGGSATIQITVNITPQDDAPTINGTPATTATDGVFYSFTPTANDIDSIGLGFSIVNKPTWATFNSIDGSLTGTPGTGDVAGSFVGIVISVTADTVKTDLPAFAITVNAPATGGAVWDNYNWDGGSTWQ